MCWKSKDGGATKMTLYGLQFQHLKDLIVLKPFEMNSKKKYHRGKILCILLLGEQQVQFVTP